MRTIEQKLWRTFKWRRTWGVSKTIRGLMLFVMCCRGMTRQEVASAISCNDQELGRFLRRHNADFDRPNLLLDPCCVVEPAHLMHWTDTEIAAFYEISPMEVWHGRRYRRITKVEELWWTIERCGPSVTECSPK